MRVVKNVPFVVGTVAAFAFVSVPRFNESRDGVCYVPQHKCSSLVIV